MGRKAAAKTTPVTETPSRANPAGVGAGAFPTPMDQVQDIPPLSMTGGSTPLDPGAALPPAVPPAPPDPTIEDALRSDVVRLTADVAQREELLAAARLEVTRLEGELEASKKAPAPRVALQGLVARALVACQKPLHMRHMSPPDFERWCRVRSTIEAIALAVGIDPNA